MHAGDSIDKAFRLVLIVKSIDGVLEIIGGVLLLIVSQSHLNNLAKSLTEGQLSRNPHDFVATHLLHSVQNLSSGGKLFGAFYLLSHGLIKVILVAALLKNKLWAYPWMIGFLALFIVYQIYRMTVTLGLGLLALTVFDILVLWLTYIEYKRHHRKQLALER